MECTSLNYSQDLATEDHKILLGLAVIPITHEGKIIGAFVLGSGNIGPIQSEHAGCRLSHWPFRSAEPSPGSRAENALHSSQQNFRMLFDTIKDFMFVLDLDGIFLKTNTMVEKRLGYSAAELQKDACA